MGVRVPGTAQWIAEENPQAFVTAVLDFGVVAGGGYQAAGLFDGNGRLLQVFPARPDLIGRRVGLRYKHLRPSTIPMTTAPIA